MIFCALAGALPSALLGQEPMYPEVVRFAAALQNIIWDFRGTSGLKHLRYDGDKVQNLLAGDRPGSTYEHAFLDAGILRLNFKGSNTGWYFFSDDLRYVTPLTVKGEIPFTVADESNAKPVVRFPQDLEGVVWESEPDERNLKTMKMRWNGTEFELGVKDGARWNLRKEAPLVAERRVFEFSGPEGVVWIAFSSDGKEAWLLQVENVFGGHARTVPRKAAQTPQQTGLTPQLNDLVNHAEDLLVGGDKLRSATLRRHALRQLKDQPALAKAIETRLSGKGGE